MRYLLSKECLISLTGCLLLLTLSVNAVNVRFDGELIERTCQVEPNSNGQTVQFLDRPARDFLYAPGRGPTVNFNIQLIQCPQYALGKTVKLKFSGERENSMNELAAYFLKVTGENAGKLAVGLLDVDGTTPMKLGDTHNQGKGTIINSDTLQLNFKAYVQATPDAITKKSVTQGSYSSTVNFELFYE